MCWKLQLVETGWLTLGVPSSDGLSRQLVWNNVWNNHEELISRPPTVIALPPHFQGARRPSPSTIYETRLCHCFLHALASATPRKGTTALLSQHPILWPWLGPFFSPHSLEQGMLFLLALAQKAREPHSTPTVAGGALCGLCHSP